MNDKIRLVIGSILGGLAQFLVGFVFWGTPLAKLAYSVAPEAQNAALQQALAVALTPTGTGTYHIPWPESANGTVMHGQGPVALIFYNSGGFPLMSTSSLIAGLVLSIVAIFLLGVALYAVAWRVPDFATRMKIVICASIACALYFIVGQPVFNFYLPWGYWIYLAVSQVAGMIVGGLVLAKWFLPVASLPREQV